MSPADPERALVLAYAPAPLRPALATLWRLDERLAGVVAGTREDRLGAIRLAWWREALARLDTAPPPDEPLLRAVAAELVARGVAGAVLGGVADGWAELLAPPPLGDDALAAHAAERGGRLFALAGQLLGEAPDWLAAAGEGWALVDTAFHLSDAAAARRAIALAAVRLEHVRGRRWPARLRPLGVLGVLAADDAARGIAAPRRPGSPRRVARALRHRLTGR